MNYADLEDAIVTRLSTKLGPNISVTAIPETQAQNQRPFDKPRITVAYHASNFDGGRYGNAVATMATDSAVQEENIKIAVEIESRVLRGATGIYALLVSVRQALIGFEPLGLDKMVIIDSKFTEFKENLWAYTLIFRTAGIAIQDLDAVNDPLVTEVNFDQNFPVAE